MGLLLLITAQAIKGQSFSNFPANGGGGAPRPTGRQVRLPAATAVIPNNQQQQQQLQPAFVFNPQQQQRVPVQPQFPQQPQRFIPRQPQFAAAPTQPRQPQFAGAPTQPRQPQFAAAPTQPRHPQFAAAPTQPRQPQFAAQLPAKAAPAPVGSENIEGAYVHDTSGDATISRFELFKQRKAAEAARKIKYR